jgi:hypothetical protein
MAKTEQKACLSTSTKSLAPPSLRLKPPGGDQGDQITNSQTKNPPGQVQANPKPKPDYVLVLCYIIVYLEVGWLIFMILRTYSRD